MGVERRAPPNPLRASSEKADGSGSILIDTTAAQLTITAPAQTPGLHCNKTLFFSFLFHLPFFFQTSTLLAIGMADSRTLLVKVGDHPTNALSKGFSSLSNFRLSQDDSASDLHAWHGAILYDTTDDSSRLVAGTPKKSVNSPVRIPAASSA